MAGAAGAAPKPKAIAAAGAGAGAPNRLVGAAAGAGVAEAGFAAKENAILLCLCLRHRITRHGCKRGSAGLSRLRENILIPQLD